MSNNIKFQNMQELQAYIMNPTNFKPARKKSYTIWACMPEVGTKVHNFLENSDYVTDNNQKFVLSGTRGEMWTVTAAKLGQTYTFGDGTPITSATMMPKLTDGVIDWFQVKTITNGNVSLFAAFVPAPYQFQVQTSWGTVLQGNRPGIPHGMGDFVLRNSVNGQPDMSSAWIVNGAVFADTYDNRGWTDYIDTAHTLEGAPTKPTATVGSASMSVEAILQGLEMLKSWQSSWVALSRQVLRTARVEDAYTSISNWYTQQQTDAKKLVEKVGTSMFAQLEKDESFRYQIDNGAHNGCIVADTILTISLVELLLEKKQVFRSWYNTGRFMYNSYEFRNDIGDISVASDVYPPLFRICVGGGMRTTGHANEFRKGELQVCVKTFAGDKVIKYGEVDFRQGLKVVPWLKQNIMKGLQEIAKVIAVSYWLDVVRQVEEFFKWNDIETADGEATERTVSLTLTPKNSINTANTWRATLHFGVTMDKEKGVWGTVKGRENNIKLDRSFKLTSSTIYTRSPAYYAFLIYYYACKDLRISPFTFATSLTFIEHVVSAGNAIVMDNGQNEMHSHVAQHLRKMPNALFKVKQGSYERKEGGSEITACKFVLRYFDVNTKKLVKEVPFKFTVTLPSSKNGASFTETRKELAEKQGWEATAYNLDAEIAKHMFNIFALRNKIEESCSTQELSCMPCLLGTVLNVFYALGGTEATQSMVKELHSVQELEGLLRNMCAAHAKYGVPTQDMSSLLYRFFSEGFFNEDPVGGRLTYVVLSGTENLVLRYTTTFGTLTLQEYADRASMLLEYYSTVTKNNRYIEIFQNSVHLRDNSSQTWESNVEDYTRAFLAALSAVRGDARGWAAYEDHRQ